MKKLTFLFTLLLLITTIKLKAQDIDNLKAIWIYQNISPKVNWYNERKIDTFTIGVLGNSTKVYEKLADYSISKTIKGKPFKVVLFRKIKDIKYTHILFIEKEYNNLLAEINERIQPNTLIITNYAENKDDYMINFLDLTSEKKIETNENKINKAKLHLDKRIVLLGGNTIQLKRLVQSSTKIEVERMQSSRNLYSSRSMVAPSNTESYDKINSNEYKNPISDPLSTFSIDVDRAAYANVRRFLNHSQMPPPDAVRIEELINYFNYSYPEPTDGHPFSVNMEIGDCPWNQKNKLAVIGLKGKEIKLDKAPSNNLVFLIDVSGSMDNYNKLPLLQKSFEILIDQLRPSDKVAIVVYAGAAGLVLPSTSCDDKEKILEALHNLKAGGATAGGQGIRLAYKIAKENFIKGGNNRVILATDGDFNVGESSNGAMVRLIKKKRDLGIYLTVLGFGMGNYKDSKMEKISNAGNGNYAYIDNIIEANKTLGKEFFGTMFTIAKDVKIQVEFNPKKIAKYRLIGYENRILNNEDFNDDKKDAGEIGAGHTVTAIYEILLADSASENKSDIKLKYQKSVTIDSEDLMTLKFRYKNPDEEESNLFEKTITEADINKTSSDNFIWATSVAGFGMLLRKSKFKGNANYKKLYNLAFNAKGEDIDGNRSEFLRMMNSAILLDKNN